MSLPLRESHQPVVDWTVVLKSVGLFKGLSSNHEALQVISGLMKIKQFPKDHVLIREGELGDEFFVLVEGQVSIFTKTPEGDAYRVAIIKGENRPTFGEGGLVESDPRSATIRCDSECRCLVLTRHDFEKFTGDHPHWAIPIFRSLFQILKARVGQLTQDLLLLHKALTNEIRGS